MTPVAFILVALWTSGPGLRSQWSTLTHFLENEAKQFTNRSPTGAPNGTVSVYVQSFYYCVGVIAGAWRRLVSECFLLRFVCESGERKLLRNMYFTTVFTMPNAHHMFESRTGFSDPLGPSAVSLGGCWIVFWFCLGSFFEPWRRRVWPGSLHHGGAWATDVPNGLARVWQGSLYHGGVWATDVPNGLARESLNLTSMDEKG